MSRYTLCINIKSDNRELLDNLMVTLETINGNLCEVDAVELFAAQDNEIVSARPDKTLSDPTTNQRNLFLDQWMLSDAM